MQEGGQIVRFVILLISVRQAIVLRFCPVVGKNRVKVFAVIAINAVIMSLAMII